MDRCYITNLIREMEDFALEKNIPIMQSDSINYICELIKNEKIESILEIGTAIGYSTILMASVSEKIVSIERDEERYNEALKNIKKAKMENKIELIFSDAFNTDIKDKFDMILIDAAKGKNKEFVEYFKRNLKKDGIIIIDNINFHGLVGKSDEIKSRNLRSLVRKIERFISFLETQKEFKVTKIELGDGLIILR